MAQAKKTEQPTTGTATSNTTANKGFNITRLHLIILAVLFLFTYYSIFDEKMDMNGDNLWYYILGKAIAGGQGFSDILAPKVAPHNHFPPGYPFIISIFLRLGFDNISFYNMLNGIFAGLSVLLFYLFMVKAGLNKTFSFVVCLFVTLNANLLQYATINMSEIPFMFFTIASLYCLASINYEKKAYQDPYLFLMIICAVISYYIRTTGITLLFAVLAYLAFSRKWMHAVLAAIIAFIAILPWQLRSASLGGSDYMRQLVMKNPYNPSLGKATGGDFVTRFGDNLVRYITVEIPSAITTGTYEMGESAPATYWLTGLIILGLAVFGMVKLFKKQPAIVIYVIATAGTLLLWPSQWFGIRFMLPLIPFILMLVLYGLYMLLKTPMEKRNINLSPYVLCVFLFMMVKPVSALKDKAAESYPPNFQNYFDLAAWAKDNVPANSVVCCRKPEFFYIFSGLKAENYTYTEDDKKLLADMKKDGVHYVVIDQLGFGSTPRYLVPAVQKNPTRFKLLKQLRNPDTYFLQFD